jgi:hypothetical protein
MSLTRSIGGERNFAKLTKSIRDAIVSIGINPHNSVGAMLAYMPQLKDLEARG